MDFSASDRETLVLASAYLRSRVDAFKFLLDGWLRNSCKAQTTQVKDDKKIHSATRRDKNSAHFGSLTFPMDFFKRLTDAFLCRLE